MIFLGKQETPDFIGADMYSCFGSDSLEYCDLLTKVNGKLFAALFDSLFLYWIGVQKATTLEIIFRGFGRDLLDFIFSMIVKVYKVEFDLYQVREIVELLSLCSYL